MVRGLWKSTHVTPVFLCYRWWNNYPSSPSRWKQQEKTRSFRMVKYLFIDNPCASSQRRWSKIDSGDTFQNEDSIDFKVINNLRLTKSQNSPILKIVHQCISALAIKSTTNTHPTEPTALGTKSTTNTYWWVCPFCTYEYVLGLGEASFAARKAGRCCHQKLLWKLGVGVATKSSCRHCLWICAPPQFNDRRWRIARLQLTEKVAALEQWGILSGTVLIERGIEVLDELINAWQVRPATEMAMLLSYRLSI